MSVTAISAAMRPYSMAVAPSSLSMKLASIASPLSQQIAQGGDQRLIGRRHRIVAQRLRSHPFEGAVLARLRHSLPLTADEKWHQKVKVLVRMGSKCQGREARRFGRNPKLLLKFADQCRLRRLARLELTAGKFPKPRKRFFRRPLRNKYSPVGVDQRTGDDQLDA